MPLPDKSWERSDTSTSLRDLHWLSVRLRVHFKLALLVHNQSIKQFLGGLSSGTTARTVSWGPASSQENDWLNRCVLRRRRNVVSDSADVTSSGRSFHVYGPAIRKAQLPTEFDSLLIGTARWLLQTECSNCRLGTSASATRVKGPRYPGASLWMTLCQYDDLELDSLRDAQP